MTPRPARSTTSSRSTPGKVGIYHCGLTVQGPPHIGHIRKEVTFDVARRWFEHLGYEVTLVANITDIDDKILAKEAEEGRPWWSIAYANERALHEAYSVLGCLPPTYEPRATGHIPEMLELIGELIAKGHAYVAADGSGDVYFDVRSWPAYGELSNQRIDDMEPAGDADPRGKRDPRDFALWKGFKKERGAGDGGLAGAVGARPAGLAPRVLGDGRQVPRRRVRHPRRRPRPALPPSRERAGPVACRRPAVRADLDAQRDGQPRRREDEQVGRQLAAGERGRQAGQADRASLLPGRRRTTGRSSSSASSRCDEAATAFQRIEGYVVRGDRGRPATTTPTAVVCR